MTDNVLSRRSFVSQAGKGISALWLSAHWPAIVSAAAHARQVAKSPAAAKFHFFSAEEAKEVDAISARIIPSDSTPGAREAGVIYFIDRALVTFAVDDQKTYRAGLPALQAKTQEMFPGVDKFSRATAEQQDEVLRSFDIQNKSTGRRSIRGRQAGSFFETVRVHTVMGFLIDPDAGGNLNAVGWKLIGRDPDHMFQPPFGYYDKDYAGWHPYSTESEKGKS